ncbi:MAG: DinB family protein, partial [Planctomycetota bacterium]|nr:DinB family protein [Planctomycetota bacterium]
VARAHPLDEVISRTRRGKEEHYTRAAILTHVTTHGMHHRAQIVNMLRHLGVEAPGVSVTTWTFDADPIT